jgi:integrase
MSLYRRGGDTWWFKFKWAGQVIRESTKSTSKTLAKDAERARRRELEERYNGIEKRRLPIPFSVASRKWIETNSAHWRPRTLELHELALKHLAPVFGRMLLTDIRADDVALYQLARQREKAAPRTINIEVTTLRSVMIKNRLWGNIGPDVRMLKEPESIGRSLAPGEQDDLLAQCRFSRNRALYAITEVALNTGLRSDEIRQLRWSQVDLEKLTLQVRHSKTSHGENRVVPLNSRLVHVLQLWTDRFPRRKPQHYVFPFALSAAGGRADAFGFTTPLQYDTDPMRPIGSWKKSWASACKHAKIKLRFHDLRHTAVTRLLEIGIDLERVARILGWSPGTTTEMARRYGHLSQASLRSAVEGLATVGTFDREGAQKWAHFQAGEIIRVQ